MSPHKELELNRQAFGIEGGIFDLLRTVRSRRVGRGYRIDSDTSESHPVTGRPMTQDPGPMPFVSKKEPAALTELEEALLCWAGCGPNGIAAWDISMRGGFHELTWISGRTCPQAGNSLATDLLVVNDDGAFIYKPGLERSSNVEIRAAGEAEDKVLDWYRKGMIQILDERPDVDWALRAPGAPGATLMGPYQYNLNRPGATWFVPITDAGWLNSALINFFDFWHMYPIDEWNGSRPAGVEKWIGEGKLELGTTIAAEEQLIFQVEQYPTGAIIQNIRLAAEALGLGSWCFCGFNPDVLFGAMPEVTRGLGFHVEAPNPRAPVSTGQTKIFGIRDVKEATYVPGPRFKSGEQLVDHWFNEKYGPGGVFHRGEDNPMVKGLAPWKPELAEQIARHPDNEPADWVRPALIAYIDYCVENFGQWPVTYNPMQAHFSVVVHNLDDEFYDRYYRDGILTERHRQRSAHLDE
jgi:nitroreductase